MAQRSPAFFPVCHARLDEGDQFLGVVVPQQRKVAREFRNLPLSEVTQALQSPWHEMRLTGLFILVGQFEKARDSNIRSELVPFYLQRLAAANNWDLVEASAPRILGVHLLEQPKQRTVLQKLGRSKILWEQHVAVVANLPLVKAGEFDELIQFCEKLLTHEHDLIHKATGWVLREMGKTSTPALRRFLQTHIGAMPRTMLRYAIERLPERERKQWLKK